MKKIILVVLSVLVIANVSIAQEKYTPKVKGDNAILFSFSGLGFLAAFEYQGGIGYKKYLNDKTAVRGAFSLHNTKETIPWDIGFPEGYVGENGSDKEFGIGFEVAGEIHRNKGKVDPYYGAGLSFNMTRTKNTEPAAGPQGTTFTQEVIKNDFNDGATTSFGVFALLGVEYAINSVLSLAAEYHLGFTNSSQPDMKIDNGSGTETVIQGGKYSYFGISSVGLLTLAIYLN